MTPAYLSEQRQAYERDPRATNLQWFQHARLGLFLHFGLYSIPGRHEWLQLRETIPVAEYANLADQFTADAFDADGICAFAKSCGFRYVNITTRHHDSFCLFQTDETDFSAPESPARRDLVKELADACEKHGLALFLYYSHGRDWKHPHAPNNDEWGGRARPEYDPPEPSYAYGADHDLERYLSFMERQVAELLQRYPSIGGIWLDGIAVPASGDYSKFRCQDLYDQIHSESPHALVSYKQGLLGTEDFFAPEHSIPTAADGNARAGKIGDSESDGGKRKVIEICTTMIDEPRSWGYFEGARHKTVDQAWEALAGAGRAGANLLLNTGPRADGSLDPADVAVFEALGERIAKEGYPS
jgi:alpha-L-fucosidase